VLAIPGLPISLAALPTIKYLGRAKTDAAKADSRNVESAARLRARTFP
jgi:hypothetical protein